MTNSKAVSIVIGAVLVGSIIKALIIRSVFEPTGMLHTDSYQYLRLAISWLEASPMQIHGHTELVWPPGYPAAIAAVAMLTNLSVFWASKLLNALLIFICSSLLWFRFKENTLPFLAVLGLAPILFTFFFSLSEALFITTMLCHILLLEKGLKSGHSGTLFAAGLAIAALFLVRYAGLYGFLVNGFVILGLIITRQSRKSIALLLGTVVSGALAGIYMYQTQKITGYLTGGNRTSTTQSLAEGMFDLLKAFADDLNLLHVLGNQQPVFFFLTLILQIAAVAIFIGIIRKYRLRFRIQFSVFSGLCFLSAFVYFSTVAIVHVLFDVSSFYYRFTAPALFFILLGTIAFMMSQQVRIKQYFTLLAVGLAFTSVLLHGSGFFISSVLTEQVPRGETERRVLQSYSGIPSQSVLIFGRRELYYLRPDIVVEFPRFEPAFDRTESWEDFSQRLDRDFPGYHLLYMTYNPQFTDRPFHPSIREFMTEQYDGRLRAIRLEMGDTALMPSSYKSAPD
ncbi:MAG: hypothetical protein LAT67_04425 [Balneolales bacterium]|nr:hypothetical protein [Balneolales bacterium]